MIVCAELRQEQYRAIEALLSAGSFQSMSEFIRLAVDNQLTHEAGAGSRLAMTALEVPDERVPSEAVVSTMEASPSGARASARGAAPNLRIPAVLALALGARVTPREEDLVSPLGPGRRPLWGQVNRLLPVKTALRCLGSLLAEQGGGEVELRAFHRAAADTARQVGLALRSIDIAAGRRRSEWLATGFPIGDDVSKSATRFTDQFTAYPRRDGEWDGALIRLGFIGVRDRGVGLTRAGLEWAAIENPVLDAHDAHGRGLGDAESRFYLDHVRASFPAEWKLMREVMEFVAAGLRREEIDAALMDAYGWTPAEAGTMRAGVLGRMSELGLIEKERLGTSIIYGLSQQVEEWGLLSEGSTT